MGVGREGRRHTARLGPTCQRLKKGSCLMHPTNHAIDAPVAQRPRTPADTKPFISDLFNEMPGVVRRATTDDIARHSFRGEGGKQRPTQRCGCVHQGDFSGAVQALPSMMRS